MPAFAGMTIMGSIAVVGRTWYWVSYDCGGYARSCNNLMQKVYLPSLKEWIKIYLKECEFRFNNRGRFLLKMF
jgi:hypothetical protein